MQWLKRILSALVVLVVIGVAAWTWLTARADFPDTSSYLIDLAALDALARSGDGELPIAVQHEQVASTGLPRGASFAGEGFEPLPDSHGAYRIAYADGSSVIVDAVFTEATMQQMPGEGKYDVRAFARVLDAIRAAERIVFTHEHLDHIQGVAALDDFVAVGPRLLLNREQFDNPDTADLLPTDLRQRIEPVDYETTLRIAPGVVLLRAPGHSPGSQMVYVQPQQGKPLLLIGDIAWHMDQIRNEHYRPRLVTLLLGEDRDAVLNQMRALKELMVSERVVVVSSHDLDDRSRLIAEGVLVDGFPSDQPAPK